MASLKFRHYATESALIGSSTLQVALNAMDVGDIIFIDDTQKQYIITSKNNNVVTYSTYYGKAAITGVTGTGATRTLTFSNGSEITITINNVEHATTSESCSGNANSATTLQNTRKINGTDFNGSADITTNNWGTSRNIGIVNSDGSGTAIPVSINGSNNINLKLPETIKANLEGNASTANTAISAGSATTDSSGNNIVNTYARIDKVYDDSGDYRQFLGKGGDSSGWIRTTVNGIIPYTSGYHSSLGTPSWYFSQAYIQNIHGYLYGNISGSSTSCSGNSLTASKLTNLAGSDIASSSTTWRKVWFSYDDGVTGRPALSDNFTYQSSTNTLKVLNLTLSGNATINGTTTVSTLTVNGKASFNNGLTGTLTGNLIGNANTSSSCSGNAATATKLQTARTIWGQSFDGSGNVSGALTGVTSVTASGNILIGTTTNNSSGKLQIRGGATLDGYMITGAVSKIADLGEQGLVVSANSARTNWGMALWIEGNGRGCIQQQAFNSNATTYALCLNPFGGNVGIGTNSPTSKLHVAGTGYFTSDVSSASNIIAGGYIKGETVKISSGCTLQYDSAQKCVKFVF